MRGGAWRVVLEREDRRQLRHLARVWVWVRVRVRVRVRIRLRVRVRVRLRVRVRVRVRVRARVRQQLRHPRQRRQGGPHLTRRHEVGRGGRGGRGGGGGVARRAADVAGELLRACQHGACQHGALRGNALRGIRARPCARSGLGVRPLRSRRRRRG